MSPAILFFTNRPKTSIIATVMKNHNNNQNNNISRGGKTSSVLHYDASAGFFSGDEIMTAHKRLKLSEKMVSIPIHNTATICKGCVNEYSCDAACTEFEEYLIKQNKAKQCPTCKADCSFAGKTSGVAARSNCKHYIKG